MFGKLTEKFTDLRLRLSGKKTLSEDNIQSAVRDVRLALLDADVSYKVVSRFVAKVKEKALGDSVLRAVDPGDQFIKLVHDELIELMGNDEQPLRLKHTPTIIMLCGLQGQGKTTTAAKLAHYIQREFENKKILLAACDLQRPAAVEQLQTLAKQIDIDVITGQDPIATAKKALSAAADYDALIVDTAGRLHIDEPLMAELKQLKQLLSPHEILFVANATIGQDAVKTAAEFDQQIGITGTILTMLDGNARAGAAISILEITGKPLKFEGVGEKLDAFQLFNPRSMADRILGFGDVINLVKKAEASIEEDEQAAMEKKLKKGAFSYDDFLKQMKMFKRMGSFKSIMSMMPGAGQLGDLDMPEAEMQRTEAIILSMTTKERQGLDELIHPRRARIARGSGQSIDKVNKTIKNFKRMQTLAKQMQGSGMKKMMKQLTRGQTC